MTQMAPKLLVISPCRDEAQHMRETLQTVVAQSLLPTLWIIVDDGSVDTSAGIIAEYCEQHDWIKLVSRSNRGHRSVGPGVIEAFYFGLQQAELDHFDFVCKLDLDLRLPPHYFAILVARMASDHRLGSCS